ncbi:MAG: PD-(D/E)XK nuclease-like domain-containing protein [Bacteroides nordii]
MWDDINLNDCEEGEELNPSAYNPDDYPTKEEMLDFISLNCNNPPVNIDLKELSINGLVKRDPMELYLKSDYISSSNLKNALKTPRSFYYDYERVFEEKEKPCFQLGTFAHMAFLEPRLFELVKVEPKCSQSSKEGVLCMIRFYQELLSSDKNYIPDVEEDYPSERWNFNDLKDYRDHKKQQCADLGYSFISEEMSMIIKALERNYYWYGGGIIPQILKGAYSEVSFYGKDLDTGLNVRVRPDYFNVKENIGVNAVISFKTTRADDLGKFYYDCAKLKYELSEGMYQEVMSSITGRDFNVTIMIMLQTVEPYDVAVLFWAPDDLATGKYKYHYALSIVKDCFDKKFFPGYDANAEEGARGIIDMQLPEWSQKLLHPVAIDDFE